MPPVSLKGKERALNEEDDLNPVITYRHLLNSRMGVSDPLRVVALCDLDAFYAQAECVRLKLDPDVPLAVQQWQALIAVNYPARTYGITRMETAAQAKKKCPNLVLVHTATYKEGEAEAAYHSDPNPDTHKVRMAIRESSKILKTYQACMEAGVEVEKASIDEAFFDFTAPVKAAIISRYSHLAEVPAGAPNGLDTPLPDPPPIIWNSLGNLVPVNPLPTRPKTLEGKPKEDGNEQDEPLPSTSQVDADEDENDTAVPEPKCTWHDVALSIAAEFMKKMKQAVKDRLGYTTTAGIARNKMLAKLVASYRKRDQQTILRNAAVPNYLRPMDFQKIRFLGGKLGSALADEFGAKTVGDVLSVSLEEMQIKFGEESIWVYNLLRGIDHSEVKERIATKSMLASKNTRPSVTKLSDVTHWLRVLASELSVRLVEAREISTSLWPKTLVLHVRQSYNDVKSRQCAFPYSTVITPDIISKPAERLFKELLGASTFKISNLQLAFSGLNALESGQRGIEGFFAQGSKDVKADRDVDVDLEKHQRQRKRSEDIALEDETIQPPLKPPPKMRETPAVKTSTSSSNFSSGSASFLCGRCKKTFSISKANKLLSDSGRAVALEKLKAEHIDFHVAEDLSREVIDVSSSPERRPPPKKKARVTRGKQETGGIAKYFGAPSQKK
ncbi:DNA-directed DNA polymerase eta rad30 [Tulasnella sp. 332]|nr:DNA-directed DNA polymerase eta rad30 [Tulasnella sp. 332]